MKRITLITLLGLAVFVSGCSEDSVSEPGAPAETVYETPQALIEAYIIAQEEFDQELLAGTLHSGFRVQILAGTMFDWESSDQPLDNDSYDRDEFVAIHGKLFGDQTGLDHMGRLVPPVVSASVEIFDAIGLWQGVNEDVEYYSDFDGAQVLPFGVLMHFNNPDQHTYELDQRMDIYTINIGDEDQGNWRLLGIFGHQPDPGKAVEAFTYCRLLAIYR